MCQLRMLLLSSYRGGWQFSLKMLMGKQFLVIKPFHPSAKQTGNRDLFLSLIKHCSMFGLARIVRCSLVMCHLLSWGRSSPKMLMPWPILVIRLHLHCSHLAKPLEQHVCECSYLVRQQNLNACKKKTRNAKWNFTNTLMQPAT